MLRKKTIQWGYSQKFPRYAIFFFIGGLHIEQQFLKINGLLVSGTGLKNILGSAQLSYTALQTVFCDVNDIKKARYAVEVVVICFFKQLKNAHATMWQWNEDF